MESSVLRWPRTIRTLFVRAFPLPRAAASLYYVALPLPRCSPVSSRKFLMTTNGSTPARTPSDSAILSESQVTGITADKPAILETAVPGARLALTLLLLINLFNYIDRQVLAAVEPSIRAEFFPKVEDPKTGEMK